MAQKPCNFRNLKNWCYVLSQTWSPALKYHIDYKERMLQPKCYWTLHGLWIRDNDNLHKNFANKNSHLDEFPLNFSNHPELKAHLEEIAPCLFADSREEIIHKNMYKKHGTVIVHCNSELGPRQPSSIITTPEAYFKKAVELAYTYHIDKHIERTFYGSDVDLKELSEHIKNKLGHTPYIKTLNVPKKNRVDSYIDEVYLCFDKNFGLTNCKWVNNDTKAKLLDCPDLKK